VKVLLKKFLETQKIGCGMGIQSLAAKEITSRRKEIVQRVRPWEKAPMFLKAQEKAQKAVVQQTRKAQRKGTARAKA
jgi:hypothetical protein